MAALLSPAAPDLTQLDFTSLRERLIELCGSVFPDLDLDSLAEMATLLLETNAWIGDVLAYYVRAVGREARITTATQRRGLLGLVKLIGFRVPGATPASASVTLTPRDPLLAALTLPGGPSSSTGRPAAVVQTAGSNPVQYQLLDDVAFPPAAEVAVGSNGADLSTFTGAETLNVDTTAGFPTSGSVALPALGNPVVSYTGTTGSSFTGCSLVSGSGVLATGQAVNLRPTVTAENSAFQEEDYESTRAANQSFLLSRTPYLDRTLLVTDGTAGPYEPDTNPTGWREVESFLSASPTDRVYTTAVDDLDRCLVIFGNGSTGAIPSGGVTFQYRTGGGSAGTVSAHALVALGEAYADDDGNGVVVLVDNPEAASPGADRFTVAQIQQLAPASLTVQHRAVSNADYETGARLVPGVLRALFLTAIEDESIPFNMGIGFVVPTGGGQPSAALLQRVLAQFQQVVGFPDPPYPKANAFPIEWLGVDYLDVDVSAVLYLRPGAGAAATGAAIRTALAAYLAPTLADGSANPTVDFGYNYRDAAGNPTGLFAWGDLFDLVSSVPGVLRVDPGPAGFLLNGVRADLPILSKQFPRLGDVTLVDAGTGLPI